MLRRISLVLVGLLVMSGATAYGMLGAGALFFLRYTDKETPFDGVEERRVEIPDGERRIPAKIFEHEDGFEKVVVVIHGAHWKGFNEPRLLHFARSLASAGYLVVAPDVEDIRNYELVARAVDDIERVVSWVVERDDFVKPYERVGLMGISFAGGLSLSAASRSTVRNRIGYVFSFGGHGDMERTLDYLITGEQPGGFQLAPHVYGQAVVVRFFAHRLVPADQVEPLRSVLFDYLKDDKEKVRKTVDSLGEESAALVRMCLERDNEALSRVLSRGVGKFTMEDVLSPVRGKKPGCPVFLLHGSVDNVIPPSESVATGDWLQDSVDTHVLVSEVIKHVDLGKDEPSLVDYLQILRFWTLLLAS